MFSCVQFRLELRTYRTLLLHWCLSLLGKFSFSQLNFLSSFLLLSLISFYKFFTTVLQRSFFALVVWVGYKICRNLLVFFCVLTFVSGIKLYIRMNEHKYISERVQIFKYKSNQNQKKQWMKSAEERGKTNH